MKTLTDRSGNKPGYAAVVGHCGHSVIVGASPKTPPGKYIPIMGLETADGAAWMYLNHFDTPIADHPQIIDGKINFSSGGFEHEQYNFNDDRGDLFKWNMHWPNGISVPKEIRFKLTSEGLIFQRQLRPDQMPEGMTWGGYACPEAEDSFVIWRADGKAGDIKFKDGTRLNRGNGKVGNIYSMFFTDEAGARSPLIRMELTPDVDKAKWLTLYIEDAQRPEIMAWLLDPSRVGRVTLDPILGYDVKGSLFSGLGFLYFNAPVIQAPVNSIITKFGCYMKNDVTVNIGVYNCEQADPWNPEGFSFVGGSRFFAAADVRAEAALQDGDGILSAGVKYRLGLQMVGNFNVYFDTAPIYLYHGAGVPIYPWPPAHPPVNPLASAGSIISTWLEFEEIAIDGLTRSGQAQALGVKSALRAQGSGHFKNPGVKGRL